MKNVFLFCTLVVFGMQIVTVVSCGGEHLECLKNFCEKDWMTGGKINEFIRFAGLY